MELGTKALYNALKFRTLENEPVKELTWQISDLRALSLDALFHDLIKLGFNLDKQIFLVYAEECDSPEDMVELLADHQEDEEDPEQLDRIYLILFELWRRLVPERPSISILCDELDRAIYAYDTGEEDSAAIWDALEPVLEIVQSSVDQGMKIDEAYRAIEANCAHDLRRFFTDFILDLLDSGSLQDAEDLFARLKPYFEKNPWTWLIEARFIVKQRPADARALLRKAIATAEKLSYPTEFFVEAAQALRWIEDDSLLTSILDGGYRSIHSHSDGCTYLELLSDAVSFYDLDSLEREVQELVKKSEKPFKPTGTDPFMVQIQSLAQAIKAGVERSQSQEAST